MLNVTGHYDRDFETNLSQIHDDACAKLAAAGMLYPEIATLKVEVTKAMRTTAGTAHYHQNKIRLNYRLLSVDRARLERTYNHELAHLAAVFKYGLVAHGHGKHWAHVMTTLGFKADRCHNYDTSALKRKRLKFEFTCGCFEKSYWVTEAKASAYIAKDRRGTCRACRKEVVFSGQKERR